MPTNAHSEHSGSPLEQAPDASRFDAITRHIQQMPRTWLVTGAAGFIGSHLVEWLLEHNQWVVGVDNYSTGSKQVLDAVLRQISAERVANFQLLKGDISDESLCMKACQGVDHVLHQAALGSVPRSMQYPLETHRANVNGMLAMALAARKSKVKSMVYASSSSVYGDHEALPKVEGNEGAPCSPYAATKRINELYAQAFWNAYEQPLVGLRYFNVVGPRQDPQGPYAAVVPRWLHELATGVQPTIFGDGSNSRDFCPVQEVVRANVLAAMAPQSACGRAYNVALGKRTTLNELFLLLRDRLADRGFSVAQATPRYVEERPGDVAHSHADISLAKQQLGYYPTTTLAQSLDQTTLWMVQQLRSPREFA